MDMVVAEYATVSTPDEFWAKLAAVLTDEVVIIEAQAVGMDWPELAVGRRRLEATRAVICETAAAQGWVSGDDARRLAEVAAAEALALARPWIEAAERRALLDADRAPRGAGHGQPAVV